MNEREAEYGFVLTNLHLRPQKYNPYILDLGTGNSPFAQLLRYCEYRVYTLDLLKKQSIFICADMLSLPFKSNSWSTIVCISVIEHIENFNKAFSEIAFILNPNGILFITFPYNYKRFIPKAFLYGVNNFTNIYSQEIIDKWLIDNKMEIIKKQYYKDWTGDYWRQGQRLWSPIMLEDDEQECADLIALALRKI